MAAAPLIRRLRDAQGILVTYLPLQQTCETVGVSSTSICRWVEMGLVRYTGKLNGSRNYAVVDVARLKMLTRKDAERLGIRKIPDRFLASQRAWHEKEYAETFKRATYHRERWDDKDVEFVLSALEEGRSVEIIAKALGRTYDAVINVIVRLRAAGEIDPARPDDPTWQERTASVLTESEYDSLTAPEEEAA